MIIEVNNLVKRYKDLVALDHFNLQVNKGEIYGLLGPNGSGKTTAINCMLSLLKYDRGRRAIKEVKPGFLIIDSVQTMNEPALASAAGSVSQVREVTNELMRIAKNDGLTTFVVGHVTKDGAIAGPKMLEHMVDTVLYFEGDMHHTYRILRAVKNRYGSTNEIGIFSMEEDGLHVVDNPSESTNSSTCSGVLVSVTVPSFPFSKIPCSSM